MSTKRLARTVIEPGRATRTKVERKTENRSDRRASRILAATAVRDPAIADRTSAPRREPIYVIQKDKLAPITRWLRAQRDRPWGEVYADIRSKCDVRTTPGRHILYDHLLRDVQNNGIVEARRFGASWRGRFWVDEDGILRYEPPEARRRYRWGSWGGSAAGKAFVGARRVRELGGAFFWMEPLPVTTIGAAVRYRQDRRLTGEEVATWKALGEDDHKHLAWRAPDAPPIDTR